jgi:predicted dehydrogenase
MRAAVVGTGSSGTRHATNLLDAGVDVVVVSRAGGGERMIGTTKVPVVGHVEDALPIVDAVVVANPTSLHFELLSSCISAGRHVLCEKPVSTNATGVRALAATAAARDVVVAVCCQMRFHPLAEDLHRSVRSGVVGDLLDVETTQGEHLADYHPDEDYRTSYAARASLGGGVLLTQIHQLDLLHWLLGPFATAFAVGGHYSELEIDVEDSASYLLTSRAGVPARGHTDYLQRPKRFDVTVTGSTGRLHWDYCNATLTHLTPGGDPEVTRLHDFERNDMFVAVLDDFLHAVTTGGVPRTSLDDAAHELAVVDAIKESMASRRAVGVDDPEVFGP